MNFKFSKFVYIFTTAALNFSVASPPMTGHSRMATQPHLTTLVASPSSSYLQRPTHSPSVFAESTFTKGMLASRANASMSFLYWSSLTSLAKKAQTARRCSKPRATSFKPRVAFRSLAHDLRNCWISVVSRSDILLVR